MIASHPVVHAGRTWLLALVMFGCSGGGPGPQAPSAQRVAAPPPAEPAQSSESAEQSAVAESAPRSSDWRGQDAATAKPEYESGTKATADIDRDAARDAYRRGVTLYQLGKFREAIEQFELAYDYAEPTPLLLNIAQAYRKLGDRANAIRYYQMVIDDDPSAPSARLARAGIAELRANP